MQEGLGFLSQSYLKGLGNKEIGPGEETRQLHGADKCPETMNHKSIEKMGSPVPCASFFYL